MRGMILAAGRGARMGELTSDIPKPLIRLAGYHLIEYSIFGLAKIGIKDIIINVCYRGEQIKKALGNGSKYNVTIHYSEETEALETGGGIYQALPLLGSEPFIVLSCDVISSFSLQNLPKEPEGLAHLVLVNNPEYHPKGDFCLEGKKIYCGQASTLTFGNIGVYRPELFANSKPGIFRLGTLLKDAIRQDKVTGEHFKGVWYNLGTPDDLNKISAEATAIVKMATSVQED